MSASKWEDDISYTKKYKISMFWYPLLNEKTIMIDILKRIVRSVFLGIVRLALAYVFSKCYIGGHSTNIGFEKRIQIKQDQ